MNQATLYNLNKIAFYIACLLFTFLPKISFCQNNALAFDGINDYVNLGNVSAFNFNTSNSFTIEAWFKTSATGYQSIFSKKENSGSFAGYELMIINGNVLVTITNDHVSNGIEVQSANSFSSNIWHHVAWTYAGNSLVSGNKIYVDGVLQTMTTISNTLTGSINTTVTTKIGSRSGVAYNFNGQIDEVRVWNIVRTASEISGNMNCSLTGYEAGLVANYNFNQGVAGAVNSGVLTLQNNSQLSLNGSLSGFSLSSANTTSNWVDATSNGINTNCPNVGANALHFDGVNDHVQLGNAPHLNFSNFSDFTIEAWFKTSSAAQQAIVSKKEFLAPSPGYEVNIINGQIRLNLANADPSNRILVETQGSPFNDNVWHQVTIVYNGTSNASGVTIYVDGIIQTLTVFVNALTASISSNTNVCIGARGNSSIFFDGSIDEVRIWNHTKTAGEILNSINCELSGNECGLLAYYNFNQGLSFSNNASITTLNDLTPYDVDGALNGFALQGASSNWSFYGATVSGNCNYPVPIAQVKSNNVVIASYDITPSTVDNTDFGYVLPNNTLSKIFYIKNPGTAPLILTGFPYVHFSGGSQFAVTSQPSSGTIYPGDSAAFTIKYQPTVFSTDIDTVIIGTNPCLSTYKFVVTGYSKGNALHFDSTANYVDLGNPEQFNFEPNSQMTIEAWFKTSNTGEANIFQKMDDVNSRRYRLYLNSGKVEFDMGFYGIVSFEGKQTSTSFNDNIWHHVAVSYNGNGSYTGILIYVDGQLQNTLVSGGSYVGSSMMNNQSANLGYSFNGYIDEVRVWNKVRTQTEIQSTKNCELHGYECGLVANYNFNQGVALNNNSNITVLNDLTGNHLDGELVNFGLTGATSNWVASGAGLTNYCNQPKSAVIRGNGINIENKDYTPIVMDNTDFGYLSVNASLSKTFYIKNPMSTLLILTGSPFIQLSGSAQFVVTQQPVSGTINPGDSVSFTITYQPTVQQQNFDTIKIVNNSCASNYQFLVKGTTQIGQALHFDGINDRVSLFTPYQINFSIANQFTMEAWFKTSSAAQQAILSKMKFYSANPEWRGYELGIKNGKIYLKLSCTSTSSKIIEVETQANTFNNNSWHHVAVSYNGNKLANGVQIYVDGILQTVNIISNNATYFGMEDNMICYIGCRAGASYYFNGSIDEVRIWNNVRTASEIQSTKNCELHGYEQYLIAYYKFNQGIVGFGINATAQTLIDQSTNHLNGGLNNFSLSGPTSNWVAPGGTISGFCVGGFLAVKGNNVYILHTDFTPRYEDQTNFGFATLGTSISKTFYIKNVGSATFNLTGTPYVQLSGNSQFVVTTQPTTGTINPGDSVSFTITFQNTMSTLDMDTVKIPNTSSINNTKFLISASSALGKALLFSGSSNEKISMDYPLPLVGVPSLLFGNTSQFTMEVWVKTGSNNQQSILSKYSFISNIEKGWNFYMKNGKVCLALMPNLAHSIIVESDSTFNDNAWHHLAVSYNGSLVASGVHIYVDGVLQPFTIIFDGMQAAITSMNPPSALIRIGSLDEYAQYFTGTMDELRVWNHVKTQSEIQNFKNCEITGFECGLILYCNFNQGLAGANNSAAYNYLYDSGPNAYKFKVTGFSLNNLTSNFIEPGANLSGHCLKPTILVLGNNQIIRSYDYIPSLLDGTYFDTVSVGNSLSKTFYIKNPGAGILQLSGSPFVQLGTNSNFAVTSQPTTGIINPGDSVAFTVTYTSSISNNNADTITIANNACEQKFKISSEPTVHGKALHFDGYDDRVNFGNQPLFDFSNTSQFTIEAWFKTFPTDSSDRQHIFSKMYYNILRGYEVYIIDGRINVVIANLSTSKIEVQTASGGFDNNLWHHVAVTYNGNSNASGIQIYVDGVQQSLLVLHNNLVGNISSLTIARIGGTFDGSIDEMRIWSYVRTQSQIQNSMNCELTGQECNLLAYYTFNQGFFNANNPTEHVLIDITANHINGNLESFALNGLTSNWTVERLNAGGPCQVANLNFAIDTICISQGSITLLDGTPAGGTYSGVGISGGMFNASIAGVGEHTITYTYNCVPVSDTIVVISCLGSYADTSIVSGQNINLNPSEVPFNIISMTVHGNNNFPGVLTINPSTGVVSITNAKHAGTYTVTVVANGIYGVDSNQFILTVTNPPCSPGLFLAPTSVSSGTNPYNVVIGDFNGDGIQDLATANNGSNNVSIRLGDGLGGFDSSGTIAAGAGARFIGIGDFNADGKQDFAIANKTAGTVSIRLGDGLGGFSGSTEITVGSNPTGVVIADFDKDGKQDFATCNLGSNTVSIQLGDGSGGFSSGGAVAVSGGPQFIAIGDFNNDGNEDIATPNNIANTISIRLGNGLGGFASTTDIPVGSAPSCIAIGDFNEDGKQDLAVTNNLSLNLTVLLGDSLGMFTSNTIPLSNKPNTVSIGDFNGDGHQDLLIARTGSNVNIRLGDGTGNFTSSSSDMAVGISPYLIAVGDFNQDGKQDFATGNTGSDDITIRMAGYRNIEVAGNGFGITDGDSTVSVNNQTYFDSLGVGSTLTQIYTIENNGDLPMSISSITSSSAAFIVSNIPSNIPAGSSATFTITYSPTTLGIHNGIITINNDDCNKTVFDFVVRGIGKVATQSVLNLTCFIEGYWDGTNAMQPVLLNQGQASALGACDSIDVELHDTTSAYAIVASTKTVLQQNGTAVCNFPYLSSNYYIVIKHRNALETWSANPVFIQNGTQYNFTTAANKAFGSNQIEVEPNVWALYSGDLNADENIDLLDLSQVETDINTFQFGYFATDINGDGNVDLLDVPTVESNINNFVFSLHP